MRKIFVAGLGAIAALGLSACSEKAQNEVGQAADSVGSDLERGINNADDTLAAGADKAGRAIDNAGHDISAATRNIGADARNEASDAKKDVGDTLEEAGKDIKH